MDSVIRPAWFRAIVFCAAYLFCAAVANRLSSHAYPSFGFWLPSGLYVGVLLMIATREWGWFLTAALVADILIEASRGHFSILVGINAVANSFEAVLGAALVRRFVASRPALGTLREVVGFLFLTAGISAMAGAFIWAGSKLLLEGQGSFVTIWLQWWSGDASGILVLTPFMLVWRGWRWEDLRFVRIWRWMEAALLVLLLSFFIWLLFYRPGQLWEGHKYLLLPLIVWAALRFGLRGVTVFILFGAMAMAYPSMGRGTGIVKPASNLLLEPAVVAQWFIVILSMTGLVVAAVWRESSQNAQQLRENEAHFRMLYQNAPVAYQSLDAHGNFLEVNQTWLDMMGYEREEVIGYWFGDFLVRTQSDLFRERFPRFKEIGQIHNLEFDMERKDGRVVTVAFEGRIGYDNEHIFRQTHCVMRNVTEIKRAENALRESELRYRTLFDEAVEGIVLADRASGMVRDCNQAFLALTGCEKAELAGRPLDAFVITDKGAPESNGLGLQIPSESSGFAEAQIRAKSGERKIVEIKTKDLELDGEVVQQYFFHDITARKHAEEERNRLFELSMDMLCVGGFDGYFKQINPAWNLTLGWSDHEMLAMPWLDLVHPEDRSATLKAWEDLRKGVAMRAFENRFRCKDASYRWLSWNSIPLVEDAMVFAVVRDTTDLRKAVEAVRDSEERLRFAMEGANDGLWDVQMKTGAFFLSPRGCEILGYQTDEIGAVAKVWNELVHPDDLAATNARLKDHIQGRLDVFEVEQRLRMKDGCWKWVLCRGKIVKRDPDGTPVRIAGTHSDITKRKKAEDELKTLNAELERRVLERTTQLEAANKELEAFAYSISHDLRAPLRAINGFSNILIRDYEAGLNPEASRFLQLVSANAQKMGRLIDDLLAFSRLSRQSLRKQTVNTADLVQTALAESVEQKSGRQIEVRVGDLPACQADPALLKQVWINLLSNAFKYTRHCEAAVIEVGVLAGQGDSITFFVRDNGAGFDMQYAGKLFGVFQRLHREDEFEGTGVGLAIVQRIVQRHGGRVWAEGRLKQGASFYFTLPT
jgi:PAS domain S-box-containing protein